MSPSVLPVEAMEITDEMMRLNPVEIASYNRKMECLLRSSSDAVGAIQVFHDLQKRRLEPDKYTYNGKSVQDRRNRETERESENLQTVLEEER